MTDITARAAATILQMETPPNRTLTLDDLPSIWDINARTEWIVEDLVPQGALTLLTGDSGVGKSTLALALLGHVSHGTPFLGKDVRQSRTLYVDGENPAGVVRERLDRLGIARTEWLQVWGGWNDPPPGGPGHAAVLAWAQQHKGLIVYDSLIQFHSGSEQDASETRSYMTRYRELANAGAAVLLLHHTGKGENSRQYRGSSDIKASVDQAFCLEAVGEGEGIGTLRLRPFKERIAKLEPLRIEFTEGQFRNTERSMLTNREVLESLIEQNPNSSGRQVTELAMAAGVPKQRCGALLTEGARDGWLLTIPGTRGSVLYRLRGPDD